MRPTTILGAVMLIALPLAAQQEPEYMQPAPGASKPRTAVFELTVHNQMPDDDINVVIDRLHKELRATNEFYGCTPLHIAVGNGRKDITSLLVSPIC